MSPAGEIRSVTCSYTHTCAWKHPLVHSRRSHFEGFNHFQCWELLSCIADLNVQFIYFFFSLHSQQAVRTAFPNPFYASLPHNRGLKTGGRSWLSIKIANSNPCNLDSSCSYPREESIWQDFTHRQNLDFFLTKVVLVKLYSNSLPKCLEKNIEKNHAIYFVYGWGKLTK